MQKSIHVLGFIMLCCTLSFSQKASKQSLTKGKLVFEQYCLTCHQADGSGVPNLNPPLIKTSFVLGDKKALATIVINGLSNIEVEGEKYSNPMPAFSFLSDEEIANVLTYVRNSFTNKASAITEADVKASR